MSGHPAEDQLRLAPADDPVLRFAPVDDPVTADWAGAVRWDDLPALDLAATERHRLVVVAAHPDDETLGAAGLIAQAADLGWSVEVVVATRGEASHPHSPTHSPQRLAELRSREVRRAVARLAPSARVHLLELPDSDLAGHTDRLVEQLVDVIGDGAEVLLVAPWEQDRHADHEAAGRAARTAAGRTDADLLGYPVWLWHWGAAADLPRTELLRLDLNDRARHAKRAALDCHVTQHRPLSPANGDEQLLPQALLDLADRPFEVFFRPDASALTLDPFEDLHQEQADPWAVHSSWYERRKRALTLAALPRERFARGLEVGCSVGALTADLAGRCERLLAVDASAAALARAAAHLAHLGTVSLERVRVPDRWPAGRFDLIALCEIGYFCSPRQWDRVLDHVVGTLAEDGIVVACHWRHPVRGWPMDGDRVHERLLTDARLQARVAHTEGDLVLHLLTRPGTPWVAEREGLV